MSEPLNVSSLHLGYYCCVVLRLTLSDAGIDGIFGEVLFYTLRKTLGPEAYSTAVQYAWVKVMSRILRVIIPMVVRFEMTLAANTSARLPGQIKGAPQRGYQPHLQHDTSMFSSNRSTAAHSGDGAIERQPATLTAQR